MKKVLLPILFALTLASTPAMSASYCGDNISGDQNETILNAEINALIGGGNFSYNRTKSLEDIIAEDDWIIRFNTIDDRVNIWVEGHRLVHHAALNKEYPLISLIYDEYKKSLAVHGFSKTTQKWKKVIDCLYTRQEFRFWFEVEDHGPPAKIGWVISHQGRPLIPGIKPNPYNGGKSWPGPGNQKHRKGFKIRRYWGEDQLEFWKVP